jgi:hypothetical protein
MDTGKREQVKLNVTRRKKIIKIETDTDKIENRKPIEKINKTKSWTFGKLNKIDKPSTQPDEEKKEDINYQCKK